MTQYLDKDTGLVSLWNRISLIFARKSDVVTSSANGLMLKEDKNKLDSVEAGATANEGTVTSVGSGVGLTGGPVTASGTLRVKLKSEEGLSTIAAIPPETLDRNYAVVVDSVGDLSVTVPWEGSEISPITSEDIDEICI